MAEIRWTNEAVTWLKDIFDYINQDSPSSAERVINALYEKFQILINYPEIGYRYCSEEDEEIRILLYDHYRIAYFVDRKTRIDIFGVFHGTLDIEEHFL